MYLFKDMKLFNWSDVLKTDVKLAIPCKTLYVSLDRYFILWYDVSFINIIFSYAVSLITVLILYYLVFIYTGDYMPCIRTVNRIQVNYKYAMMIKSLSETFSFRLTVINCEIKATKEFSY
jgi:hypothetical protein